jgi:hypothetical protein
MRSFITTNHAGTIAEGEVSQEAAPRDPRRDLVVVKNPSSTDEPLFYSFGTPAAVDDSCPSLEPGESLVLEVAVPSEAIHVAATTEGHRFVIMTGKRGNIE